MKRGVLVAFLVIVLSISVYACENPVTGGVKILGTCFDCGVNTDDICPEDYGATCKVKDLNCCGNFEINSFEECDPPSASCDSECMTIVVGYCDDKTQCSDYGADQLKCGQNECGFNAGAGGCYWETGVGCTEVVEEEYCLGISVCGDYTSGICEDLGDWCDINPPNGCVWDGANCVEGTAPSTECIGLDSCDDYSTLSDCNNKVCPIGVGGIPADTDCYWDDVGGIISSPGCNDCSSTPTCASYADAVTCVDDPCGILTFSGKTCLWDAIESECYSTEYLESLCTIDPGYPGCEEFINLDPSCDCSGVYYDTKCVNDKRVKKGSCSGENAVECFNQLAPSISCAKPKKFPIFDNTNLFIAVLLLLAYYFYVMKRGKKK